MIPLEDSPLTNIMNRLNPSQKFFATRNAKVRAPVTGGNPTLALEMHFVGPNLMIIYSFALAEH
jgi:hypothetical protein